ncbi:DUF3159 domain-containing protein [Lentzea sp. NPDC059081]|uniref:DUF3159 domain-containing protein n=1 Tax=Lentzea sp. NPDC059081 TaxID=3346719 RepID=UPI0036BCDDD1
MIDTITTTTGAPMRAAAPATTRSEPDARHRVKGAVFEIAPIFTFTATFAVTHRLAVALSLAVAAGIAVCVHHLVRRESLWRALAAVAVVGLGGLLAVRSGEAADFFLPGLVVHGAVVTVNLALLAAGWPLLGLVAGVFTGEGTAWRRCRVRRRAYARGSLVLLVSPVTLMAAGLPLYLSGQAVALGLAELAGPFLFTLGLFGAWRVYRRSLGAHDCAASTVD